MLLSWKTNGTPDAVNITEKWVNEWNDVDYAAVAKGHGRTSFKFARVGEDLVITEEWSITKDEYDMLDIIPATGVQYDGTTLPIIETEEHLGDDVANMLLGND